MYELCVLSLSIYVKSTLGFIRRKLILHQEHFAAKARAQDTNWRHPANKKSRGAANSSNERNQEAKCYAFFLGRKATPSKSSGCGEMGSESKLFRQSGA